MRSFITAAILLLLVTRCTTKTPKTSAKSQIQAVLKQQQIEWNSGNLEGFMQGYLNSDSLKFYGRNGLTKGWENTLMNYKKGYPTTADKGQLQFTITDISAIEANSYWVMGQYHLTRLSGNTNGVFMLIFKNINGTWRIVADMSC